MNEPVPPPVQLSSVMYRLGGRNYPLKTVRGCNVCRSPFRIMVENSIIAGYSFKRIAEELPADSGLNAQSIHNHFTAKHLPLAEDARRALIEKRAMELDMNPETAVNRLDDHISFLRLGVHDVMTRMASRQLQPDIKDGIAMAKALSQIDIDKETEDNLSQYVTGLRVFLETAREVMDAKQFKEFSTKVLANETIRALMNRPAPPKAIEGASNE